MTIPTGNLDPGRPASRDDDCGCGGGGHRHDAPAARSDEYETEPRRRGSAPRPLERNAFYPRKLMEVRHWQAEQDYHRRSRQRLTRLATGTGILCGLDVRLTEEGTLVIEEGVAVDGRGRQIIVPYDVEIDPAQPTDACGKPKGERLTEGSATIALCYRECGTDVVALPSESCEGDTRCTPSMIREAFAVTVRPGAWRRDHDRLCAALRGRREQESSIAEDDSAAAPRPSESDGASEADDFVATPGRGERARPGGIDARRQRLDRLAPKDCGCAQRCVPLATVVFDREKGARIDRSGRTVIRSNTELLELILCLAEQLEDCCRRIPAAPPRIVDVFPWPDEAGTDVGPLLEDPRVEVAFDRPMGDADLAAPASWLGLWAIRGRTTMRAVLTYEPAAAVKHVLVPTGGSGAVYSLRSGEGEAEPGPAMMMLRADAGAAETVLLIMARSGAGGVIRAAGSDQLALDADLAATELTAAHRAALWKIDPGATKAFANGASATWSGPVPPLPSGDGDAEGELHAVLPIVRRQEEGPHLQRVWPAGGREHQRGEPEADEFFETRRLRITTSAALDQKALDNPSAWLRAWIGIWDLVMIDITELTLGAGELEELNADGSARYAFELRDFEPSDGRRQILVGLWPEAALGADPPVGEAVPQLLDADFEGTVLSRPEMERVWQAMPERLPELHPVPTDGAVLHDGAEGGIAFWAFHVFGN